MCTHVKCTRACASAHLSCRAKQVIRRRGCKQDEVNVLCSHPRHVQRLLTCAGSQLGERLAWAQHMPARAHPPASIAVQPSVDPAGAAAISGLHAKRCAGPGAEGASAQSTAAHTRTPWLRTTRTYLRLMPVRVVIHSSLVSTRDSRSWLEMTSEGAAAPTPVSLQGTSTRWRLPVDAC